MDRHPQIGDILRFRFDHNPSTFETEKDWGPKMLVLSSPVKSSHIALTGGSYYKMQIMFLDPEFVVRNKEGRYFFTQETLKEAELLAESE